MLRGIISALVTVILVIITCLLLSWALDYYRVHSADHTVATVCSVTDDHAYTSEGILDANDRTLKALQPGQTYSIYTQKMWPWEFPTIMAAARLNVSAPAACGPSQNSDPDPTPDPNSDSYND